MTQRHLDAESRRRLLEETNRAYAALRADQRAWEAARAEHAEWDVALADGLEDEPLTTSRVAQADASGQ